MNHGIYGLGGQIVTPVQGPFSGVADARKMLSVQALVVGGGGGGANAINSSRPGPGGGGGGVLEQPIGVTLGTAYAVTVGAGGASQANGSHSLLGQVCAAGGAGANNTGAIASAATGAGATSTSVRNASVITPQGFSGGLLFSGFGSPCGGGGGAGSQGGDGANLVSGSGGNGRASSITGSVYLFGGGGGSGSYGGTAGSGGASGGGGGSVTTGVNGSSGASNGGGGGGGGASGSGFGTSGGSGGSGVVILRWNASQAVAVLSSGLTGTRTTAGADTVLTITAGTGSVTWS